LVVRSSLLIDDVEDALADYHSRTSDNPATPLQ
jgi:hypothetical protein